jgi:glutamyl-tRNA synthetase
MTLPSTTVKIRTRYAPSPTGYTHLGNIRTALFAWAFARHHEGVFVLRIEDTDQERSTPEAVRVVLDAMRWLGLNYDEGPYYQMQRMREYKDALLDLLAKGHAYRCYTTMAELDALREAQTKANEKPRYDGRWRPEPGKVLPPIPAGVEPVIRFKNPASGVVAWDDQIKGRVEVQNSELDDLVIARPDGTPTYNFCVVVDDIEMAITHVIRGDDHVNNTPRQINMYLAFGKTPPVFAHTPTVLGQDGAKLSKRHGAKSVMEYEQEGFLPDAMINMLARMGWSHGNDEIFTRQQLTQWFEVTDIGTSASRFDPEKLLWLNQEHIKRAGIEELGEMLMPFLIKRGLIMENGPSPGVVANLLRDRCQTLVEMADVAAYFYEDPSLSDALLALHLTADVKTALQALVAVLATTPFNKVTLSAAIREQAGLAGLKLPMLMMPLRVLLTGREQSPAVDSVMQVLGSAETLRRLQKHLK